MCIRDSVKAGAEQTIEELNQKLEEEVRKQQEISSKASEIGVDFSGYIQKQNFLDENIRRTSEEVKGLVRTGEELRERQNEILAEIQKKQAMAETMEIKNQENFDSDDSVKSELNIYMKEREEISGRHKGLSLIHIL